MPKVTHVHPILASSDVAATVAFCERVLGFESGWTFGGGDGAPVYGGASLDGHEVHFSCSEPVSAMRAYIEVDDVDAYRAEVVALGGAATEPRDQPYGLRDFSVTCEGGPCIGFASKIPGA